MSLSGEDGHEDDACLVALQLSYSIAFPTILKAGIDLKIFEMIGREGAGGYVSASHIASQFPTQDPDTTSRLDRMLRFFVSHSVLTCSIKTLEDGTVQRLYGLTAVGQFFAGAEARVSMTSVVNFFCYKAMIDVWLQAKEAILEGGNQFERATGVPFNEYTDKDPVFNDIFNQAMAKTTAINMNKVMEIYKGFEGLNSLVDVGGGIGICLNMVVSKYPFIKGINFDLPHVTQSAPSYPGVEHVGGDMFSVIPKADAIMIKSTLHNWDDEHCKKVLRNCYHALPRNGKVIAINLIMSEVPESTMVSQYVSTADSIMLLYTRGKERTEKEYEAMCKASGFSKFRVACLAYSLWGVMEFIK